MDISDIDQLVLLAIAHLESDAYGVTVRGEIARRGGRKVSMAGVYSSLERLERLRLVEARISEPVPKRGGRARKLYRVAPAGAEALIEARAVQSRMWSGLEDHSALKPR